MQKGFGRFTAIAVGLIVIGLGVAVYHFHARAKGEWVKFSAPDGDFSILMPSEPEIDEHQVTTESGKPETTAHFLTAEGPTSTFFCNYWDLSFTPADETDAQMTMAGARDGLIERLEGKLLSHDDSMSEGHSAQSFKATLPDNGILEGRYSIVGQRMYMLAVAHPAEQSDEEAQKFFGSFKRTSSNP